MDVRDAFVDAQQRVLDRYGVGVRSRFVQDVPSIAGRAHVLVGGDGPPVVLVNGLGIPAAMLAPLMAELMAERSGFRLFAIDLPGHGLTDSRNGFADNLRPNAVRFLEEVLDELGLVDPMFIANSMGSLWVSWFALDRPHRARALIHVGCPALALDTSAPLPMRLLSARPLGRMLTALQPPSPKQVAQLSKMVKEYPLPPEIADLLVATERMPQFRETFLALLHALLRLRGSRPGPRLTAAQLADIRQPTLLFWGENDPFGSPEVGKRMAAVMPDAELRVVDGGHAPYLRQSGVIGPEAVRFLDGA